MMVNYEKLQVESIKDIQIDKVNIKFSNFPKIAQSEVLQEVIYY